MLAFVPSPTLRASAQTAATAAVPALDAEEAAFCRTINTYRAEHGLGALRVSTTLANAATWDTNDMAAKNYFSHTDSLGRDPFQRMTAFGYGYATTEGENIAAGTATAAATFDQWKASAGHNQNMLTAAYKVIGISRSYSATSTYGWYWNTDFGGYTDASVPCPTTTSGFTAILTPGDFNGDGKADLIARTSDGHLILYPGNGAGGFQSHYVIGSDW
ncbi:MAG: CAP domain-containing protein [Acidimicrobiales bacterium]